MGHIDELLLRIVLGPVHADADLRKSVNKQNPVQLAWSCSDGNLVSWQRVQGVRYKDAHKRGSKHFMHNSICHNEDGKGRQCYIVLYMYTVKKSIVSTHQHIYTCAFVSPWKRAAICIHKPS